MMRLVLVFFYLVSVTTFSQEYVKRKDRWGNVEEGYINKSGDEIGEWKNYFKENGRLREIATYDKEGILDGPYVVYFKSGELEYKGQYLSGKKSGTWTYYYKTGKIRKVEGFKANKGDFYANDHGEFLGYYINGQLQYKKRFKNGEFIKATYYDYNGKKLDKNFIVRANGIDGEYIIKDIDFRIKGKKFYTFSLGKGLAIRYYANGIVKTKFKNKGEYMLVTNFFKNSSVKSISKYPYAPSRQSDKSYTIISRTGITKEYNENGTLVKEIDEDYKNGNQNIKKANSTNDKTIKSKNFIKAHRHFVKSAANNNTGAMSFLGYNYYYGRGVDKDYNKSVYWFQKAIKNGTNNYEGLADAKKKITEKKERQLKKLINDGESMSLRTQLENEIRTEYKEQLDILLTYYNKEKKENPKHRAFRTRLKKIITYYNILNLTDDTRLEISTKLKVLTENAKAEKDRKEREKKYKKDDEMFKLILEAAKKGDKTQQYNVAIFYGNGMSMPKNIEKAIYWAKKSGDNGYNDGYLIASSFSLDGEKSIIDKMNSLGSTGEDNKEYEILLKKLSNQRQKALNFLEKFYLAKEKKVEKYILKIMQDFYKFLKIDSAMSKEINQLLN
ncbi:MAG: SEL1-like repeat protein [Flavobacteriaceae bacterium]